MKVAAPLIGLADIEGNEIVAVAGGEFATVGPVKPEGRAFADTRCWR